MNKIYSILFLIVLCFSASCGRVIVKGEGPIKTEAKNVGNFSKINIDAPINAKITVQEGSTASVSMEGYESLLKHITVKVVNNTLEIVTNLDNMDWNTDKDVIATITLPALTSLEMHGAVEADLAGNISGDKFQSDMSGGTKLSVENINVKDWDADLSGAGDLLVKNGVVDKFSLDISGAGNVEAFPLQANDVHASVSGAGEIKTTALKTLNVDISGAGNVSYKGNPTITKDISGAGALNAAN